MFRSGKRLQLIVLSCALGLVLGAPAAASARPARYEVGAAKADITPTDLNGVWLGGYGIGPSHAAGGVLRHAFARAIAVRDRSGQQVVIAALDLQGHFQAYQNGPYGFADMARDIQAQLGIPPSHLILQSTHTHNGMDDLGVWGGVPDSYLAYVKAQTEAAIIDAVRSEQPAVLRWGTADMTGFSGTFGTDDDSTHTGDNADYPMDNQLRVLQGVAPGGRVIATMVNYSTHATVYGPLNKVSPDWPGATATFLEHSERSIPASSSYGYPGSVAVVTVGAMGHTWPAGTPRGTDPAVDPAPSSDNGPADDYGNAVGRMAITALAHPHYEQRSVVAGTQRNITVANTNAALLALGVAPVPGYHINRANTPPYGYGDAYVSPLVALRVGDLAFFSSPGEPYPSIEKSLAAEVGARATFIFGLAEDQLGYVEEVGDYNGAFQCSASDEWFFTISPTFGSDLVRLQRKNAHALGFGVTVAPLPGDYGPGQTPPATNCTRQQAAGGAQQIGQGVPSPPAGIPGPPAG